MTMPNFLIIGAPKGGTTTLHYVLEQHPELYMCPVKEAGFFWAYGEEVRLYGPGAELLKYRVFNDLGRYQKLFEGVTTQKAIGEASVRYLSHPRSPGLIHQFIPQAKLIVSLRQPAERAFSSFTRSLRDGLEPSSDFAEALEQERKGLRDQWTFGHYLDKGFYYADLSRYLEYFERRQLHISLMEDLKDNPVELMHSLFRFLEVDDTFTPDMSHQHNVSGVIRNPILRTLWTRSGKLRSAIRPLFSERVRHNFSEWVIQDVEKVRFSPELRAELTEYYRQDIEHLQDLIGRDLSHWLKPA
jgi:hypothetical protein